MTNFNKKIIIFSHCFRDSIPFILEPNDKIIWKNTNQWLISVLNYLKENNNFGFQVILRPHPNSIDKNYEEIFMKSLVTKFDINIENEFKVSELLASNDGYVIFTWFGNIFYEAIKENKKVFYFNGSPYSACDREGKWKFELEDNLIQRVEEFSYPNKSELQSFSKYYYYYYPKEKKGTNFLREMTYFDINKGRNSFISNLKIITNLVSKRKEINSEVKLIEIN